MKNNNMRWKSLNIRPIQKFYSTIWYVITTNCLKSIELEFLFYIVVTSVVSSVKI